MPAGDDELPGKAHKPTVKNGWVIDQGWVKTLGLGWMLILICARMLVGAGMFQFVPLGRISWYSLQKK